MAISDHTENNQKSSEGIRVNHGNHETLNNLLQVIVSVICVIHMSANSESQMLKTSSLQTLAVSVGWLSTLCQCLLRLRSGGVKVEDGFWSEWAVFTSRQSVVQVAAQGN